ncbi:MAG: hypothetical protein COV57_00860 [Candidatus Liptonbacteria bacterium CG11_big_fil_rev_8_21_14_0_20_35_14]|uniref:Type II secretion system protein GspF domain-containing protein n=1 Tax=Candidatus Liptonbacteria bacterium CG11_big_fil_rev_8_21_14_0_20_35_14 TaxID=1974634 RepID=A0A2H0NAH6_9BACT|nr:MAG: hypothetical protein COV57_00860 [Candidatus Liptonbacteria bacterium CG11_big_fil_rev_8_21_14_0_20_35_14]
MKYHYVASEPNGKVVEGEVDVQGPAEVLQILSTQGLRPVSIKPVGFALGSTELFRSKVALSDKVFLSKYLALMLKVGTDLLKAINILIDDFDKPAMKRILIEIRQSLEQGKPFYSTFAKYPKVFSQVFVSLVRAGEASGNLEIVFGNLSTSLEKEQEINNKIKSALVYPMMLLSLSFLMVIFLVTFALPKVSQMFQSGGFDPPTFSLIVFAVGNFIGTYIWILAPLFVVSLVVAWYFFLKTLPGRKIFYRFINFVPVISTIVKKIALQRFARTLASLMKSGLPIVQSLEITAETIGHEELKQGLLRISREGVSKGLTIGEAFKREPAFPKTVTNLIAVSERAGHVEDVLDTLAEFYESEIDVSVKTLISFIEPTMLLVLGVAIGTIALSIIIPIYQLVGQF